MTIRRAVLFVVFLLAGSSGFAAPPVFESMGQPGVLSDRVTVVEGEDLDFVLQVGDPDGDPLSVEVEGLPDWLSFDAESRRVWGRAPLWAEDDEERNGQPGTFDVSFNVSDGTSTVSRTISFEILDAGWEDLSLAELVAARPLAEPCTFHTPVQLEHPEEQIIHSEYGGGVDLRRVCFGFTSQVPAFEESESDWSADLNCAYLPVSLAAASNVGAVVEGAYAQSFGESELAERAAAELGIPVLIIDRDWDWGRPSELMGPYIQRAAADRDPAELFYVFSVAHYIRGADALVTVINSYGDGDADYDTFQVVFAGLSKMGHTAFLTSGVDPDRVAGFLSAGAMGIDGNSQRLLAEVQGSVGSDPESHVGYLGVMTRSYVLDRYAQDAAEPDTLAVQTLGTDDSKDDPDNYTPKYSLLLNSMFLELPACLEAPPNAPHTLQTPIHSQMWRMILAHLFLGRPLGEIESIRQVKEADGIRIQARISAATQVRAVTLWYTGTTDLEVSHWSDFVSRPMEGADGLYEVTVPSDSTAYLVQVEDSAGPVKGIFSSATLPVNRDYPLLPIPPDEVDDTRLVRSGQGNGLEWTNPSSDDFVGVLIVADDGTYPESPLEGRVVYDGGGESAVDDQGSLVTKYTVFSYDAPGNYSEGRRLSFLSDEPRLPEGRAGRTG